MQRGVAEKHAMIDRLEVLRASVRADDIAPRQRADLEYAIAEMERDILVDMPTDTAPLLVLLAAWGPRLRAAGHAETAAVVDKVCAELRAMGV
jgi:hypothetical protein